VAGRARILLIDDAEFAFKFLLDLLADLAEPPLLEWRGTWETGLESLTSGGFDVCLLDFQLGERSGFDLMREAAARGCRTPIVLLTGQGTRELDLEAQRLGAADYLVKGDFTAATLERVVRYAIERARTLERLRESEERYSLALQGANDGLWDWRVGKLCMHLSPRWKAMLGYGEDELADEKASWWSRVHPDDVAALDHALARHIEGETAFLEQEHRLRHRDGSWRHVLVRGKAVRNAAGEATRLAGSLTDVTDARSHDALTGLPNRVLFYDRLEQAFLRARRDPEYRFAVLFVDLDRFKNINDSLGHTAGDELLVGIARRLERCIRAVDTVARLGGDEFTILLDDAREPDGALRVAARVVEDLSRPFHLDGHQVFTGASVGIALSASHYARAEDLMRDADTAMYSAKAQGKGRFVVFDQAMHERALKVLSVESGLRRAIEERELEVHYQPVFTVKTKQLVGLEALVRWRHPERGMVAPLDFVPIAEDSDLIAMLDRYVLREATRQLRQWREVSGLDLFVAVNASRKQFARPGFAEDVQLWLDEAGLPAAALHLEVTETVTMDPAPLVGAQLSKVAAHGVALVIDDFGVGYSSLAVLHRFPFKGLKVDRSFVVNLDHSPQAAEVVRAILAMACALGLSCTAEGVETDAQYRQLEAWGCLQVQGFLLSKPLPAEAATAFIAAAARAGKAG
jgi:diguanylate cyclase (GGDEF)-like protein/PAS domain S-box-containing protein